MSESFWRAEENYEEEVLCPWAPMAHTADVRLERSRLRKLRARVELNRRRYLPVHR